MQDQIDHCKTMVILHQYKLHCMHHEGLQCIFQTILVDCNNAHTKGAFYKGLPIANTATHFKKTKLPTATIYGDGYVAAQPGATSFKLKAATKMAGISLAAQYGDYSQDLSNAYSKGDSSEFDLIVGASLGAIDAKLIYMNFDHISGESQSNVRAILSTKF